MCVYSRRRLILGAAISAATSPFFAMPNRAMAIPVTTVTWTGQTDDFWNTTSVDWHNSVGSPVTYANSDAVLFQDVSPSSNYTVSLVGTLTPGVITVDNDSTNSTVADAAEGGNYLFEGSGSIGAGASNLVKIGGGSLTFDNTAANGHTGGNLVYQGVLAVDLSSSVPTNLLSSSSSLTLNGAGFSLLGASSGSSSQAFSSTDIVAGQSQITVGSNGGPGTTLNLGMISLQQNGGTVNFTGDASSTIMASNILTSGVIGGWATYEQNDWASISGSDIVALASYTNDAWASGNNTTVTMSSAPSSGSTTNSLRFASNNGSYTLTLSGANTITTGGILVSSAVSGQSEQITGGTLTAGGLSPELVVIENDPSGSLNIASQIIDGSSATSVVKSGPGTLYLSNASNSYSGPTYINDGILSVSNLASGGSPSAIGESAASAGNLYIDGGTFQYTGSGASTNRLFTIGPEGATIDASGTGALDLSSNSGVISSQYTQASNSVSGAETLTLTGTSTANNTFSPILNDPGTGQNLLNVIKNGAGTWVLPTAESYTGGTTINAGILAVSNTSGSATGGGAVTINGGTLGGGGTVTGPVAVNSGGSLTPSAIVPGGATDLTISNNLTLSSGAALNYDLDTPNVSGPGGQNDLTSVGSALNLNPDLTVNINPGTSFATGTYTLVHYASVSDNSSSFQGWNADLQSAPAALSAGGEWDTMSFSLDTVGDNLDLNVATNVGSSPSAPLTKGQSAATVIPNMTSVNQSAAGNPLVQIKGGAGGNSGPGGNTTVNFYMARPAVAGAKGFSIGWAPAIFQLVPGTPYFAPSGVLVGDPAQTGIPTSPNAPYTTNAPFNPPGTGQVSIGGKVVGAVYPAGTNPPSAAPDDWLPVYYLAPVIIVTDPPATPTPTYYGESYTNPNDLAGVYLADIAGGEDTLPAMDDSLSAGADDQFNYQGSFLSLVESDFPSITDLSQMTSAEWDMFDGSYGVDTANDIAWSVDDAQDADYSVVAVAMPEPSTVGLMFLSGSALDVPTATQCDGLTLPHVP